MPNQLMHHKIGYKLSAEYRQIKKCFLNINFGKLSCFEPINPWENLKAYQMLVIANNH